MRKKEREGERERETIWNGIYRTVNEMFAGDNKLINLL